MNDPICVRDTAIAFSSHTQHGDPIAAALSPGRGVVMRTFYGDRFMFQLTRPFLGAFDEPDLCQSQPSLDTLDTSGRRTMAGEEHRDLSSADLEPIRGDLHSSTERMRAELDRLVLLLVVVREHEWRMGAAASTPPPPISAPRESVDAE